MDWVIPSPEAEWYWLRLSWYFGDGRGDFGGGYFDSLLRVFRSFLGQEVLRAGEVEQSRIYYCKRLGLDLVSSWDKIWEVLHYRAIQEERESQAKEIKRKAELAKGRIERKRLAERAWHLRWPEELVEEGVDVMDIYPGDEVFSRVYSQMDEAEDIGVRELDFG